MQILSRHPDELLPGVSPVEFIAAIGICVTMKALPVLGAILGEMNLFGTRIGNLALGVAGVIDIILWITLAVLLTAAAAGQSGGAHGLPPIYLAISVPLYLFLMVRVVRPALGSMLAARIPVQVKDRMLVREVNARALVVVGAATMASALATELMGLHYHHRGVPHRRDHARPFTSTDHRSFAGDDGRVADALLLRGDRDADLD